VQRVMPAARAEAVELQPPRVVPLVLARAVRALLAGGARQRDHWSVLGLGHVRSGPRRPARAAHVKLRWETGGKPRDSMPSAPGCQRRRTRDAPRRPPRPCRPRTSCPTSRGAAARAPRG